VQLEPEAGGQGYPELGVDEADMQINFEKNETKGKEKG